MAWAVFAFAGRFSWTLPPIVAVALALAVVIRPRPWAGASRLLDGALLGGVAVAALQLVPLPGAARAALSPNRDAVASALILAPQHSGPLTLDPSATAWALAAGVALLLLMFCARALFERQQGIRHVARGVAWIGLALASLAFMQRALSPALIYGMWRPADLASNILPWGPFINRNDFAAWLLMAIPLTIGYLAMRISSQRVAGDQPLAPSDVIDARLILLLAAVLLMTAAVLASLSRSGILSMAIALTSFIALARGRVGGRRTTMLVAGLAMMLLAAASYANVPALLTRMNEAWPSGIGGRLAVWGETWPIARDFPMTGVGVGAFERAMLVYQQSNRLMFFNHAHNEYLQVLTEGGLLLTLAAAIAVVAATRVAARHLRADRSPVYWLRAGAVSGMVGIACQSVWDTPLRLPANAVLLTLLAAIALHQPQPRSTVAD